MKSVLFLTMLHLLSCKKINKEHPLTRYWMPLSSKCLQLWGKRFSRTLIRLWYQAGLMVRKQSCSNTSHIAITTTCLSFIIKYVKTVFHSTLLHIQLKKILQLISLKSFFYINFFDKDNVSTDGILCCKLNISQTKQYKVNTISQFLSKVFEWTLQAIDCSDILNGARYFVHPLYLHKLDRLTIMKG